MRITFDFSKATKTFIFPEFSCVTSLRTDTRIEFGPHSNFQVSEHSHFGDFRRGFSMHLSNIELINAWKNV